jgi:pimeloyl-ACP methyl ester carboxylesterase
MADDTAELLRQLKIEQADFFGFSMGAAAALEVAVRHPELVRKLAVLSGAYNQAGFRHTSLDKIYSISADDPMLSGMAQEFTRVGAGPDRFTRALSRIREAFSASDQLGPGELRAIRAETLVMSGEDGLVYPEHIKDLSRLVRRARLHLFSGDDHHPSIVGRSAAMLPSFLDTPPS